MTKWNVSTQKGNKEKTELEDILLKLVKPAISEFQSGHAGIRLGETGTSYDSQTAEMEGLSRLLWGVAPLLAGGRKESQVIDPLVEGIKNGINPTHPEYWGELSDYDQRLVEMSVYGYALCLAPDQVWGKLTAEEQEQLVVWLSQSSKYKCHDCNWLFFPVLVQLGLKQVGAPYCQKTIDESLDRVEAFYLGDGWYADGQDAHRDYYVPFAIHFYSLFYAKMMENEDPKRAATYKERAALFAQDFIYWFADDGAAIPFGRSMTYRFSQAAFWSAVVFADVEVAPYSLGEIKGILFRHIRQWMELPIFDTRGVLTIGYAYPNLCVSENYNSPGSPYWALKTFLFLALAEDHPFWEAEEEKMPVLADVSVQPESNKVLARDNGHAAIFNPGHTKTNDHTHTSAKYEKFVYSSHFGFSVPRGEWGLEQAAFDSMLALSEQDHLYRVKRTSKTITLSESMIQMVWQPWNDVEVETWVIPVLPGHLRVHRIKTARHLSAAEGGFAVGLGDRNTEPTALITNSDDAALYSNVGGTSAIKLLYGKGHAKLVFPNANTNLVKSRTSIPTIVADFEPGTHIVASIVYGTPEPHVEEDWASSFSFQEEEGSISFYQKGDEEPRLKLSLE
ncbi:DUF2264 domain-containing protein [Alkalicoccobacillus murimartini]|uniref:DUF2264 domain-containing protein n=1 Tax=Alkalicoccobacillus murimartini TaxID=171685 RepID=A0ABT9YIY9_9BACI|nr:DUF2264 domain-containing protein [Alkalicoccobacillus murimartini]MDQ0207450.1 hypothetical protein [Alkalicoccobacillus murimartini]